MGWFTRRRKGLPARKIVKVRVHRIVRRRIKVSGEE